MCVRSGFAAGIYTTNTAEACLHCANNGQADIIVVEDRKQLEKILAIKDQIPTLKAIIQYSGKPHVEGVITVRRSSSSLRLYFLNCASLNSSCCCYLIVNLISFCFFLTVVSTDEFG